jgi:hypothetical protein
MDNGHVDNYYSPKQKTLDLNHVDGSYKPNHIKLTISKLTFNCPSK